jgi:hypothetical protein
VVQRRAEQPGVHPRGAGRGHRRRLERAAPGRLGLRR